MSSTIKPSVSGKRARTSRVAKIAGGVVGTALAGTALVAGSATPASAAGPYYLKPWYTQTFPTWFGSNTTFCVQNPYWTVDARVRVNVWTGAGENVTAGPGATNCISRSWWGASITVQNVGAATVKVWTF